MTECIGRCCILKVLNESPCRVKYLSHLYWAFLALAINDFKGRDGWKSCAARYSNGTCETYVPITGDQILEQLDFNANQLWLGFVGLAALTAWYNVIGYILLRRSKPRFMPLNQIKGPSKRQMSSIKQA